MYTSPKRNRSAAATRLRRILQDELERRQGMNARYSLRAFARSVQLEHSTVSQLLHGKRAMTWRSIQTIAGRMRWNGSAVLRVASEQDRFNSRQIAHRVGISVDEVNIALTDLCLFGLIELKGE